MKLVVLFVFACLTAVAKEPAVQISKDPLSSEQIAIYKDFLAGFGDEDKDHRFVLNLVDTTIPLSINASDRDGCASDIVANGGLAGIVVHRFPAEMKSADLRLVDRKHKVSDPGDAIRRGAPVENAVVAGFASAILTFSEIAFDKQHRTAAFSYSFVCGRLCGHGGLVIYELQNGKWSRSKRDCASWIS